MNTIEDEIQASPAKESRLEAQWLQSQKLESAGQMAAGIAHDFNNILTIIQGYTSLLLAQGTLAPEMREPLRQISIASERATNLTRQLMTFSRKQTAQPQALDLNETVQSMGYLLRRNIGEQITQQFVFAPHLPQIQADPSMIEQIIVNLAVNARDAMPRGGKLTLSTSVLSLSPEDCERNPDARPGLFVCLTVADTGEGIAPEALNKIFDPFFTTKPIGKGTGLGLSLSYGIIQKHHGRIEVHSIVGKGTTFRVWIPIRQPQ